MGIYIFNVIISAQIACMVRIQSYWSLSRTKQYHTSFEINSDFNLTLFYNIETLSRTKINIISVIVFYNGLPVANSVETCCSLLQNR